MDTNYGTIIIISVIAFAINLWIIWAIINSATKSDEKVAQNQQIIKLLFSNNICLKLLAKKELAELKKVTDLQTQISYLQEKINRARLELSATEVWKFGRSSKNKETELKILVKTIVELKEELKIPSAELQLLENQLN